MTEIAVVEGAALSQAAEVSRRSLSWSAAIAGLFAAMAVSFIIIALGSGLGLSFASPYGSGPSATSLTIAGAVWLVMSQAMGFATGGYLAARLRISDYDATQSETRFRDAAQGLVVWAIGVVVMAAIVGGLGLFAASAGAQMAAGAAAGGGPASRSDRAAGSASVIPADYFVDLMFRSGPGAMTAGSSTSSETTGTAAAQTRLNSEIRDEVARILVRGVSQSGLDEGDRAYLAQLVAARTGLPQDEAHRRVATVEGKAREAVKETADKVAKAGAYFSFWTFMSLLFGGVAAALAGLLGGELRDADAKAA